MLNKQKQIEEATKKFGEYLDILGFDWRNDDNMKDTPQRVSKMYINELFSGLGKELKITSFDNENDYNGIVFQGNIDIKSVCSHHFCPFIGKAHIAYIPSKKVIGLSKLNRIAEKYARQPQLQERLTKQIHDELNKYTDGNLGIAVMVEAKHTCVSMRGIGQDSTMKTIYTSGAFREKDNQARQEFLKLIEMK